MSVSTSRPSSKTKLPSAQQAQRAIAHVRRAQQLANQGRWIGTVQVLREALKCAPTVSETWAGLTQALLQTGSEQDAHEAIFTARKAVELNPQDAATNALCVAMLLTECRFTEALEVLELLAPDAPRDKTHYSNYGSVLLKLQRPKEAIQKLLQCIGQELHFATAHYRLGIAFRELHMIEEAAESFRTAWILAPRSLEALEQCIHQRLHACQWDQLEDDLQTLLAAHTEGRVDSSLPFCLIGLPVGVETLLSSARQASVPLNQQKKLGVDFSARKPHERIRVGYVSNDFRHHATSMLMVEMLERRDPASFEVTLYSYHADDASPLRKRMEQACDHFVDIKDISDLNAARRIAHDEIDILVDLKGFTAHHRLGIFAARPAPVQVGWLGFPASVGGSYLDYFIGDPITTPLAHQHYFDERLAQMPVCYQPNDRSRPLPKALTRKECGLPDDAFVFCSFNQSYKILPNVFDIWCRLLNDTPNSVLWLMSTNEQSRINLRREAQARGVTVDRLIFAPPLGIELHLARLQSADLFVDSYPCTAHTTASDALWVGLPMVTTCGETFASRVAASLLHAVGLSELVADDLTQYEKIIRQLIAQPERLAWARATLAQQRQCSSLFDSAAFAMHIEALYQRMWQRHQAGLKPETLPA